MPHAPPRAALRLLLCSLVFLAACGSDATGPDATPSYATIAGRYAGVVGAVAQGVALEGTFSLTITQNDGDLSGSYALEGVATDGIDAVAIQGTGNLDGSIAAGSNPSVNLSIRPGACPSLARTFSGTYDSTNRRINLAGDLLLFDANCSVVITYPINVVLNR